DGAAGARGPRARSRLELLVCPGGGTGRVGRDDPEVVDGTEGQPADARGRRLIGEARAQVGWRARDARRVVEAAGLEVGVGDVLELAGRAVAERDDPRG